MRIGRLVSIATFLILTLFLSSSALAQNPYLRSNNTWISISGTVNSISADSFILDYADGLILVEMDDGDRDADGYKLLNGDKVTVNGKIDKDFYETTTIEASSVYVEKLDTFFYASAVDEEDYFDPVITSPLIVASTVVQGTVTAVDDDEFTIDTGLNALRVEVDDMPYNPLDDKGYLKIEKGDFVRVTGEVDDDLFEGREFEAQTVTELID